jgi:hypothetical protein
MVISNGYHIIRCGGLNEKAAEIMGECLQQKICDAFFALLRCIRDFHGRSLGPMHVNISPPLCFEVIFAYRQLFYQETCQRLDITKDARSKT